MSQNTFAERLTQALGPDVVLTRPEDIAPWLSDWRGLYQGQAQAVVRPRTTEEVSRCLALCQAEGVPVVPRGGNTGLCGAATPDASPVNVVLSLDRMNAIRSVDTIANTMVAEAGCILGNLRRAAQDAGRLLPLSLAAEDSSQIGGNVATNAGGVNVVRYGMTRELVLGLEVVLPTGEIFHGLRTLRKDNTGYDLKQLLIGSEGTLGVITAVALRLFPRTDVRSVVLAAVESPAQALSLYELLFQACGARLQAYEFFTGDCLDLVLRHAEGVQEPFPQRYPAYVLMELADTEDENALNELLERVIGRALEEGLCLDAAVSASLAQLQALWKLREEISEAQRADGPHLKHDVSLPIEKIPEFMQTAQQRVKALDPNIRLYIFGHFGDGNLHYNLSRPEGAPREWAAAQGARVTDVVLDEVHRYGGSISAEHGIGQLKREHFLHTKDPLELRVMAGIKRLLDPAGIMNPGKLL
ncbi:FAD-binding oxidoreductase [Bordetella avium]|uniref:FAD-binding oxidoreductase n=1 Tax=Bordetella avium TaxID=521 RepID=UPI000E0B7AC0|nr:FAD-binding oxidoreductase [Bordetella avium]RIQ14855.1 FAD-binding protein [Bordetella avium]RIQ55145.1 FAD-binding protein [Bordetella avium]RIQ63956.1 FAD-binding protein [Bordetella avium]RIQ64267.1 FAD-binding protein [Bordetella avium]RIQ82202.1 FAD-binding protein [Bordetella avium]